MSWGRLTLSSTTTTPSRPAFLLSRGNWAQEGTGTAVHDERAGGLRAARLGTVEPVPDALDLAATESAITAIFKRVDRHVAEGDTGEHENGEEGWCRRGQAPPSTTSGLVVCGQLD